MVGRGIQLERLCQTKLLTDSRSRSARREVSKILQLSNWTGFEGEGYCIDKVILVVF